MKEMNRLLITVTATVVLVMSAGCARDEAYPVESIVEGILTVHARIDSTQNYSGFRITVMTQTDGDVDTLGTAITGKDGSFHMIVRAPEEGVYPIVVERSGTSLSLDEFVAVDGDSVRVTGVYPLGARNLRIVSAENASWSAYRNVKFSHNQQMLNVLESEEYEAGDIARITAQTSTILWSIKNTYPGTIGADIAMAESIVMMEGWDDLVVLSRVSEVEPGHGSIVEIVRAARRSVARIAGQDSAIAFLDFYLSVTPREKHAGILAEKVVAYADSSMNAEAVSVASGLRRAHPESKWALWASRATYELENLQPGMDAPAFNVQTREGEGFSSSSLKGKFIILEFFDPAEQVFQRELALRDGIVGALSPILFEVLSVSVVADTVLNEALFDGADHPGQFIWAPEGLESQIVKDYNIQILPTRYLLSPDGKIMAKYSGPALDNLRKDLVSIVVGLKDIARSTRN